MIHKLPKGSKKNLARNFRAYEFDCKCGQCRNTYVDEELVKVGEKGGQAYRQTATIIQASCLSALGTLTEVYKEILARRIASDVISGGPKSSVFI